MMSNLFSIFDTSTNSFINLNWLSSMTNMMILPINFWFFNSKFLMIINLIYKNLYFELKILLNHKFNYMNSIFFITIFSLILINNFMGLFPYIFTSSSHMIFSMSLSIPLWLGLMIYSWNYNTNFMFSHLIPLGTPNILMPFMILIETISNIIRPMTLTIRLTANMIAGHLLLTLLSQSINSLIYMPMIILIQIILLILEFNVSIIQSYVFMILMTLYTKETN